jgi:hypothetical protein
MMTTSVVNLVQSKRIDNVDELTAKLESLSSYENIQETPDVPAVFEDDNEPSIGLINLIRKNSVQGSQPDTTNDFSNTVRIILNRIFFAITLLVLLSGIYRY